MHPKTGDIIGGWTLGRLLGKGGNGTVFEATKGTLVAAIKILHAAHDLRRCNRFADEVKAMELCESLGCTLPLLDSFLKNNNDTKTPWLAMPIAKRLKEALGQHSSFDDTIEAIKGISGSLAILHASDISHRDVKPDNLFNHEGKWILGDLGLADFENKSAITGKDEKVGPAYYIAPEMLNGAASADGKAADVYSLAKSLWVLTTGQRYPLPGHQLATFPPLTISAYTEHPRAPLLDPLLDAATSFDPRSRPTMQQFHEDLVAWKNTPKQMEPSSKIDVSDFKRLLEGHALKTELHLSAGATANQRRVDQGLRVRELFRPVATELLDAINSTGLLFPELQIDNFQYGFEAGATLPFDPPGRDFHRLKIGLHIDPDEPIGTRCRIWTWYRHDHHSSQTEQTILWEYRKAFLSGGSEEATQVDFISNELRSQFRPLLKEILGRIGLL
jgi:serine/threonine protein kinase